LLADGRGQGRLVGPLGGERADAGL
jgi:hypothetical protein